MRPNLSIAKLKIMKGMEGRAFSCDLHLDGRIVASIVNSGNGGSFRWYWQDKAAQATYIAWVAKIPPIPPTEDYPLPLTYDEDMALEALVDEMLETKRIVKACKDKVLFRTEGMEPGAWRVIKAVYSPTVAAHVQKIAPGAILANEILAAGKPLLPLI